MTANRRSGRGDFLVGLLSCVVLLGANPSWAQTPTPQLPVSASSPRASLAPQLASPETAASPIPATAPLVGESLDPGDKALHLPSQDHEMDPHAWKKAASVGQSTFFDTVRKVTWAMALICFLIWLVGKFAGRSTLERLGVPGVSSSLIEVLERKRLSPGRSVMLLRVGPKVLAVAVTESGFRTLTEMDAELLKQHQDDKVETAQVVSERPSGGTPGDIARHYLSIIPGLGVKK